MLLAVSLAALWTGMSLTVSGYKKWSLEGLLLGRWGNNNNSSPPSAGAQGGGATSPGAAPPPPIGGVPLNPGASFLQPPAPAPAPPPPGRISGSEIT